MKIKKSRLGVVSHVGIVLSFVIFITFVLFIYLIIQPAVTTENKQNLLDNLKAVVIEDSSANLVSASVFIGEFPETCVQIDDFFNKVEAGSRIVVKNKEGEVLNAKISGQDLYVEKKDEEILIKVYGSEKFDTTETGTMDGCEYLSEGASGYVLGLVRNEKNIFEKKIIQLIESYNDSYMSLKERLNLPSGIDFSLGFIYSNGTQIFTERREVLTDVFIEEIPIKYISKNADKEIGSLNLGIW